MMNIDFIFLHGFLGLPSDWNKIIEHIKSDFQESKYELNFLCPDYFNTPYLSPKNDFVKMANGFNSYITNNSKSDIKVLIGYSLGGRLALHIFEQNPELFSQIFLISTNLGLDDEDAKLEREIHDKNWADNFLHEPWHLIVERWNQQSIFDGSVLEPIREDSNYRRDMLSKALVNWSLSKQENKTALIEKYQKKVVWIVGDRDKKYIENTKNLYKKAPEARYLILPQSGHRVLFDNPKELSSSILSQIRKRI
ncbi:MAG: alpha/beta fold hydrolase [Bdellovibrionales bacterium]|nr:alpha/beta fold hydrolase [Bdellovibrionales bacterium]